MGGETRDMNEASKKVPASAQRTIFLIAKRGGGRSLSSSSSSSSMVVGGGGGISSSLSSKLMVKRCDAVKRPAKVGSR